MAINAGAELYSINTVIRKVSRPSAVLCPADNRSVGATPGKADGDVLALPAALEAAVALELPVVTAETCPLGVIVIVVVYVLVVGDVGITSVAPPLVRSEPYKVVVLLLPTGMMMVIWLQALPETVLWEYVVVRAVSVVVYGSWDDIGADGVDVDVESGGRTDGDVDEIGVSVAVEATTVTTEVGWLGEGDEDGATELLGVTVVDMVPVTTL